MFSINMLIIKGNYSTRSEAAVKILGITMNKIKEKNNKKYILQLLSHMFA